MYASLRMWEEDYVGKSFYHGFKVLAAVCCIALFLRHYLLE